jgi:hypothetical protein
MIDGTYKIEVNTPLGRKAGTVAIRTQGNAAIADIDMPIVGKQHVEGRADGDAFGAQGVFKLGLMGKVSYTLHGDVVGDNLRLNIESSKGNFHLSGVRV